MRTPNLAKQPARLALERLEARDVPAVHVWTDAGATNNWSDAGNWTGGVPTSNEAGGTVVQIPINDSSMVQDIPNLTLDLLEFKNPGSATLSLSQPLSVKRDVAALSVVNTSGTNTILGSGANELKLVAVNEFLSPYFKVTVGQLTVSATISGTSDLLLREGGGVLELTRDNTFTGTTRVNQGILRLNSPIGGGHAILGGGLFVGDGNTNAAEAFVQLGTASQLASTTEIRVDTDGVFTQINGVSNVIGDLTLLGGQVTTGTGNLAIDNIIAAADDTIAAAAGGQITLLDGQHTVTVAAGKVLTITAPIVNAGAGAVGGIIKAGAGELYFNNQTAGTPNTYTGLTEVRDGTLRLKNVASNSAFRGDLSIGDGIGAAGSAVLRLSASTEIPDTSNVTIKADGVLDLSVFTDAVGAITIHGGGQILGTGGAISLNGPVTVPASGGKTATITASVVLGSNGSNFTVQNAADTLLLDGQISGATGLDIGGDGTVRFEGNTANTYTGTTFVAGGTLVLNKSPGTNGAVPHGLFIIGFSGGTVRLGQDEQLPNDDQVVVDDGSRLDLNGHLESLGNLSLEHGATVTTGAGQLTLNGDATVGSGGIGSASISGNLSLGSATRTFAVSDTTAAIDLIVTAVVSDGGIVKAGNGTMLLTGANTYTGTTTLTGGTLLVNGVQAGSDVTAIVGTLGDDGVLGKVTVGAATLAPGGLFGTLTTKNLTLGTGHYAAHIRGVATSDQIKVLGTVNLTGGSLDVLTVVNQSPTAIGQSLTIIDNNGTADAVTGNFVGLPQGATFGVSGRTYQISYTGGDGNDVVLTDVTANNTPPTITDVADVTNPSGLLGFTVGDAETPPAVIQVSASASNTTLFPAGSIVIQGLGFGPNRFVTLLPAAGVFGTAIIP